MKNKSFYTSNIIAMLTLSSLCACSSMSNQEKNTAIGAGVGAAAGAVLTGGSGLGTAAGAAVGGVIGNKVEKDKK